MYLPLKSYFGKRPPHENLYLEKREGAATDPVSPIHGRIKQDLHAQTNNGQLPVPNFAFIHCVTLFTKLN